MNDKIVLAAAQAIVLLFLTLLLINSIKAKKSLVRICFTAAGLGICLTAFILTVVRLLMPAV